MRAFLRRLFSIVCSLLLLFEPFSALASPRRTVEQISPKHSFRDPSTQSQLIKLDAESVSIFGLSVRRPPFARLASSNPEINVLVSCHERTRTDPRISNVTAICAAYSVISSEPVSIG